MKSRNTARRSASGTWAAALLATIAVISPSEGAPPTEADHDELRAMLATITEAINEGSFDQLGEILADPFVFTTSDQVVLNKLEDIEAQFKDVFESGNYPVTGLKIEPEATIKTHFVDDNNGWCYGTARETYTLKNGGTMDLTSSWTATVTKEDGKWKLSTAHVGIHFMDNPVVDVMKRSTKWALIGGGIGGLCIGALLSSMLFRRRSKAGTKAD